MPNLAPALAPSPLSWTAVLSLSACWIRLHQLRLTGFTPKVRLHLPCGRWEIKTADRWDELQAVLKLRHEIFHREHHDRSLPLGLDIDDIDFVCDHLLIRDRETDTLLGSYRLTSSLFSDRYYASHRFDLSRFLELPGNKLELGRACVNRSARTGVVLNLLWKGIGAYLRATQTQYLFGSTSLRGVSDGQLVQIWQGLCASGHVQDYGVRPLADKAIAGWDSLNPPTTDEVGFPLPPLFASYLRAGAQIAAPPARDFFMGSADFLTVLDVDRMPARMRRYTGTEEDLGLRVDASQKATNVKSTPIYPARS